MWTLPSVSSALITGLGTLEGSKLGAMETAYTLELALDLRPTCLRASCFLKPLDPYL